MAEVAGTVQRLADIERDLGERQNEYEQAADDKARLARDWDYRLALHQKKAAGATAEVRKATALVAAIEQDDLYERLKDAEARYEALKVVHRTLDTRASVGMSILKSQTRIDSPVQPSWSRAA